MLCDAPSPMLVMGLMQPMSLGKEGTTLPRLGAVGLVQPQGRPLCCVGGFGLKCSHSEQREETVFHVCCPF